MECSEVLTLLSGHIDSSNTEQEEAALQAHLAECADCRALLKAYEDIDANVAELSVPAPEGLVSSVMEKIKEPAKTKTRSPWRSLGVSAGLVAAVLALVIGARTFKLPKTSDNRAEAAAQDPAVATVGIGADASYAVGGTPVETVADKKEDVPALYVATEANEPAPTEQADHQLDVAYSNSLKRHLGLPLAPVFLQQCMMMSEDHHAAVLLYDSIDESFFDWLKEQEPELAERFETNSDITVDEETGAITVMSDYSTVMALHEWMLGQMYVTEDAAQTDEITAELLEELGLDKDMAERVFTFKAADQPVVWPESWAKDFTLRWLTGESWRLFYPEEDYLPAEDDLAFLVLIPPVDPDETIR